MKWDELADDSTVERVAKALEKRGVKVFTVSNGEEAKKKVLELLPEGSEVAGSSETIRAIGVAEEIEESGRYTSVRKIIRATSDPKERAAARRKNLGPQYGLGSLQAITEDGQMLAASETGSQLGFYVYGAEKLIWVVGTQKIVKDLDTAMKRIYEYALPLEDERARKAYGIGSSVNKILIIEKEKPGRITLILVKQKLGF